MAAALRWNVHALRMAGEAKVVILVGPGHRFPQLVLVVGGVRIMALEAIANCGAMDGPLQLLGVLVAVAGQAQRGWGAGDQLDVGGVLVDADLVATQASQGDGGVYCLAFGFFLVAFQALCGGGVFFQRDWMHCAEGSREASQTGEAICLQRKQSAPSMSSHVHRRVGEMHEWLVAFRFSNLVT